MANDYVCKNCGFRGLPKRVVPGSLLAEIFLWCLFVAPGVIYTAQRLIHSYDGCPACKKPFMSPMGKKLLEGQQS